MASITLKNINKIYPGDVAAVSGFNLEIPDKEFVVLVGPSGCGKSTTLRMIAGLEEVTEGELYIGDRLVNDVPPKDRDIAMVFQNYALYPHMTVYDNMAFGLTLRKTPKDEIDLRVHEAAGVLGIENLLERKPKALSGGERQRVALGRAMVRNPAVFLLDEPLSNLDAKLRASMRTELIRLHKKLETTFVYVTHDQTEAMTMGDRIVVMKDGLIQQVDTPQILFDSPCNIFVAGFIGSPQMNFMEGILSGDEKGYYFAVKGDKHYFPDGKVSDTVKSYSGKTVILGIRPEDIHDYGFSSSGGNASIIEAEIEVSELMGSEVYLYLKYGENPVMARVPTSAVPKSGGVMKVALDMNKAHLFDIETELTITQAGRPSYS